MDTYVIAIVVAVIVVGSVALVFLLPRTNKARIRAAAKRKGWEVVSVSLSRYAPGWLWRTMTPMWEFCYLVEFIDENGDLCAKYCETGLLFGVLWRDE